MKRKPAASTGRKRFFKLRKFAGKDAFHRGPDIAGSKERDAVECVLTRIQVKNQHCPVCAQRESHREYWIRRSKTSRGARSPGRNRRAAQCHSGANPDTTNSLWCRA